VKYNATRTLDNKVRIKRSAYAYMYMYMYNTCICDSHSTV